MQRIRRVIETFPPRDRRLVGLSLGVAALVLAGLVQFAVHVYALQARRAIGPSWKFPSHIYSDAVPLVPGRVLPPGYLAAELDARAYRETAWPPREPGTWAAAPGGVDVVLRGFLEARDPDGAGGPERVRLQLNDSMLVAVQRLGGLAHAARPDVAHPPRLEPVQVALTLGPDKIRRTWVPLSRVPRGAWEAIVASEDRRFFSHYGLDLRANARALFTNLRSGGVRQGGSTITQQLARGLFLGQERTFSRKLAEVPLAVALEVLLGKRQILEMYLNMVYWGQAEGGAVGGIAEASRWYFDEPVESLRVEQAALLAAMIPAPNALDPFDHPDALRARRNEVLGIMAATGRLSPAEAERLSALPLGLRKGPVPGLAYPSYVDYVRDVLDHVVHRHAAEQWGLGVFTSMDLAWQQQAEQTLARGLDALDGGRSREPLQGAFVLLEPRTARVRALVGGRHPATGDFNRATQAKRQTGSAIKPIVYAAALAGGGAASFTPASTVPDERRSFGEGRWTWTPKNDQDAYHPTVTLAEALARSLNVATANVVEAIGPATVAHYADAFGLGKLKPVMSIGLGTNEVSLLDLTNAFAVFLDDGVIRHPLPLRVVVDGGGGRVAAPTDEGEDVVPSGIAALMTGLLQDVTSYGVAAGLRTYLGFDRPVAGKTGTTDDFRDAWFVGYTPYAIGGVWVGFDTPRSLGDQAAHVALPVWARIMTAIASDFPPSPFASDQQLEWHSIDPWTGLLADQGGCPGMLVPFLPGTAPATPCSTPMPWEEAFSDSTSPDTTVMLAPEDTTSTPEPEPEPEPPPPPPPDTSGTR